MNLLSSKSLVLVFFCLINIYFVVAGPPQKKIFTGGMTEEEVGQEYHLTHVEILLRVNAREAVNVGSFMRITSTPGMGNV